jgi:uncharacterized membrane protein YbhN (UPF0104 family)
VPGLPAGRDFAAARRRGPARRPRRRLPGWGIPPVRRRPLTVPSKPEPVLTESARLRREARRRVAVMALVALVLGAVVVSVSGAANIGRRLESGRPTWLALAVGFELVSALGFVATFQLVFGEWLPRRLSLRMGLAVCAATIVIPAGGLVAIGFGARALRKRGMPGAKTRSRAVALLLITNAPNVIVLGLLGIALGTGLLDGPHAPILTIVPAAVALSAIGLTMSLPTVSHQRVARAPLATARRVVSVVTKQLELGVIEARALLGRRSWRLLGAVAYYAFDNAVLWATFKAFGHTDPPIATLAMAYLIGSAAGSLPIPAGIGVVEGGMVGLLVVFGAPAICAGIAVLAYRAVSVGVPLAVGGVALLTLGQPIRHRPLSGQPAGPGVQGSPGHAHAG